jgi:[protein-PII] uridylyltransferase
VTALDRAALLADRTTTGSAWCERNTELLDQWLASLYTAAEPARSGVALVATGGYGRAELCPSSDIDLILVHDKRVKVERVAERIWYPIWDNGLKLGHSVSTVRQALSLASSDLTTATALLSCRLVDGDESLMTELAEGARRQWRNGARRSLAELAERVASRHNSYGEVAFLLEPDLKEGRGGMRDVHALCWAEVAQNVLMSSDRPSVVAAYETLLAARVELQRTTGRALNVLTRQDQAAVAAALGDASVDALMGRIAEAARTIEWTSDDAWRRIRSSLAGPPRRGAIGRHDLGQGVVERDGAIHGDSAALHGGDVVPVLRLAVASAERDLPIERTTLDQLSHAPHLCDAKWTTDARVLLERLLLAGRPAVAVIETLDHVGLWRQLLPEWQDVRSRPQRNPYHRFTVDRHLLETVANAAALARTVERPNLLVVAALLHDLGKIGLGDHTAIGVERARTIGDRLGYAQEDVDVLCALVHHHLLLSDVASRRDLDDMATIEMVADAVGSVSFLRLLAALTEADGKATGPAAWSSWKAELVGTLEARVAATLRGEAPPPASTLVALDERDLRELASDGRSITATNDTLTVVTYDRPGIMSRVAGVLALRALDVFEAVAYSSADGYALSRFRVRDPVRTETPWTDVIADIEKALDGRLAIDARLSDRVRDYARPGAFRPIPRTSVTFDNRASNDATVIDIEAPDAIGMLYRITKALSDLDLDIRSARVQTLGDHVVDAFYLRDRWGRRIDDSKMLAEIERAVVHAVRAGLHAPGP